MRNESQLQLIAVQLNSIRGQFPEKTLVERWRHRFREEFWHRNLRGKLEFVRFVSMRIVQRLAHRVVDARRALRERANDHTMPLPTRPADRLRVAAICNGGMGDLVLFSGFLDQFQRECGHPEIDVLVVPDRFDEAAFVFQRSPAVRRVAAQMPLRQTCAEYDVVLKLSDFASCEYIDQQRVAILNPVMLERLQRARAVQTPYRQFIDSAPYYDGLFASFAVGVGLRRLDVLGWLGNVSYTQDHPLPLSPKVEAYRYLVETLRLADRKYITIHNGWDNVAHRHTKAATKGWPVRHYCEFVALFKQRFPEIAVVQLGAATSQRIENADYCLLNDTSLDEAAWVLKHSLLHVDGDSGLVHLARALHVTSVVMFGPTHREFFAYAVNRNLASTNCTNCWWTTGDWMRNCPRGLAEPECMASITPAQVLAEAVEHLTSLPAWGVDVVGSSPRAIIDLAERIARDVRLPNREVKMAVVDDQPLVAEQLRARGCGPQRLDFAEPEQRGDDQLFGSRYSIPVDDGAYDVVVAPALDDAAPYPVYALRESLRLVRADGMLVVPCANDAARCACVELGADGDSIPPAPVALHLKKVKRGPLLAMSAKHAGHAHVVLGRGEPALQRVYQITPSAITPSPAVPVV